jgi:O-antigen ligase
MRLTVATRLRVGAVALWVLSLALAAGGTHLARLVLDRGVAYGDASSARRQDVSIRAVNVQLEMEPDEAAVGRSLDMVRDAGFAWIRQQVSWADLEPGHKGNFWDGDRGQSTWARIDAVARLASARGIRVIARIELPPAWARPLGSFRSHPPTNVRDYADIVAAITSRYRGQIAAVQLWNEPNLTEEWGRQPVDAAAYVELLRAGFEGARRGNPEVVVVAASLAQTLEPDIDTAAGLNDLTYLDRMYAFGAAPFFDVVAANGYGLWTGPDDRQVGGDYTNLSRLLLVREVMARHGDAAKPLWVSEFGWNAEPLDWEGRPSPWGRVDEATQRDWLQAGWHRAEREWPWVGSMAMWLLRQPRPLADDPTQFFTLVRPDWTTRPAYDALVAEVQSPVLGPGTWPDGARGIAYLGTWQVSETAGGGTLRETPAPNAHMRLRFHGTRIALLAPVGPKRGLAYVTVDGSYLLAGHLPRNRFGQAMIDFGAPEARDGVLFTVASGLPDGEHRLELTVSGDAGTGSSDGGVGIDGVVVARDRSTAPETLLGLAGVASVLAGAWSVRRWVREGVAAVGVRWVPAVVRGLGDRPVQLAVLATVAALPFAFVVVPTPVGRFSPVEVLALLAIGIGALTAWLDVGGDPVRPYRHAPRARLTDLSGDQWAALLLLLGGTVGAIVAKYPTPAWREWRLLIAEPLAWLVVASWSMRRPPGARMLAWALVAGAAVAGAVAVGQAVTGMGVVIADGVGRARAFAPSPNNLALLLGRTLPIAVALAVGMVGPHWWRRVGRYVGWGAVAATGLGLALTWSRGGWVAGGVTVAWLSWRVWGAGGNGRARRGRHAPVAGGDRREGAVAEDVGGAFARDGMRRWRARVVALVPSQARLLLGVSACGAAIALWMGAPSGGWSLGGRYDSGLLRVSVWESAVAMVRDHPWVGIGLDQFVTTYPAYLQPDAWREPNLSHPHQVVLDAWLRLGAGGVVAIMALWWGIWRRNREAERRGAEASDGGDVVLRHGATAALVAVVVHGLVDNSYFVLDLAYATWAIVLIHRGASELPSQARRRG